MAYKCLNCGHVFEEGEQAEVYETHGGPFEFAEKISCCPICKSSYEKTEKCEVCGGEFLRHELYGDVCKECIYEHNDYKICKEICKGEKESVEINPLLKYLLDPETINEILFNYIETTEDVSKIDCKDLIESDMEWFGASVAEWEVSE